MTTRENRGGARPPDGVQRPASLPFARGPNRSDMSELPGTPGTPLPPGPGEPGPVRQGQAGTLRERLQGIPGAPQTDVGLTDGSQRPGEPITSGVGMGAGPGPEGLLPSPGQLGDKLAAKDLMAMYPLIMRLATLPNATTETKILAQRIRANLPVAPEQVPIPGLEDGLSGPTQEGS